MLLLTDVEGVKDADGEIITDLTIGSVEKLTAEGVIAGGMIPKIEHGLKALEAGVEKVPIINGTHRHALLLVQVVDLPDHAERHRAHVRTVGEPEVDGNHLAAKILQTDRPSI